MESWRTTADNKKPAKPYAVRVSVLLRTLSEGYLVELAGFEPASEKPTSSVLHA